MPPVSAPPRADAVKRDGARSGGQREQRRRRRDQDATEVDLDAAVDAEPIPPAVDHDRDDGDDARPHVDITV